MIGEFHWLQLSLEQRYAFWTLVLLAYVIGKQLLKRLLTRLAASQRRTQGGSDEQRR